MHKKVDNETTIILLKFFLLLVFLNDIFVCFVITLHFFTFIILFK